MKKEQGITLVALMITIIVLIILAAVTIFSVTNYNIIGKATAGTEKYVKAQQNEKKEMDNVAKILEYFENRVSGGNISGGGDNPEGNGDIPDDFLNPDGTIVSLTIGKYVDYTPAGKAYSGPVAGVDGETQTYSISTLLGSTSNPETYDADGSLKWRVFGVEDGKLLLISDKPTSYKLTLSGANGYNNGVGVLDGICKANYMNSEYRGIEVRNLKIEDVQKVSTDYWTEYTYSGHKYGDTATCIASHSNYPNYWNSHDKEDTVPFNERSKQREWIIGSSGGTTEETFRQSYWEHRYSSKAKDTEWKNGKYYDLIINNVSIYPTYCLSSRCGRLNASTYNFGLQFVGSGVVSGDYFFYSNDHAYSYAFALRPLVSIPLTSCRVTESDSDTYDYHIQVK